MIDFDPTDPNACIDRIEELEKALRIAEPHLADCLRHESHNGLDKRFVRDALVEVRTALRLSAPPDTRDTKGGANG